MKVTAKPILGFWIGLPQNLNSWFQEVEYETLPTYCQCCLVQGHNSKSCKGGQEKIAGGFEGWWETWKSMGEKNEGRCQEGAARR